MSQLNTPGKKPNKTIMGYSPRFSKFLSDDTATHTPFVHKHEITPSEETATRLRETRRRFSGGVPVGGDENCAGADRRSVLGVYSDALSKLSEHRDMHMQIAVECTRRTRVILGLITADPDDAVFTEIGQILKPLEPQYANPRLESVVDQSGLLAYSRRTAWQKEGWPERYPAGAVKEETQRGHRLVDHSGNQSMTDGKMLKAALEDEDMWNEDGLGSSKEKFDWKQRSELTAEARSKRGEATPESNGKSREATSSSSSSGGRGRSRHVISGSEEEDDWGMEPDDEDDSNMELEDDDDWT